MSHIFISHKRETEGDFAEVLAGKIKNANLSTWVFTDDLRAGEDWRTEIDEAIKDALVLIVIMSPEAKSSEYVTYEWSFALGAGIKVIPIMFKQTTLHPRLEALQHLDFTNQTHRPWEDLINTVQRAASTNGTYIIPVPRNTPNYIKEAIAALDSPGSSDRVDAIATLLQARENSVASEALKSALKHPNREVRIQASLTLAKFKNMHLQVISGLVEGLHTIEHNRSAIEALGKLGAIAVPSLLEVLNDRTNRVRLGAVKALGLIRDASAVPSLAKVIKNDTEEKDVKNSAIASLGLIGDASAIPVLIEVITGASGRFDMQKIAIDSMGKVRDASAREGLQDVLDYMNEEFRRNNEAIKQMRDQSILLTEESLLELRYLEEYEKGEIEEMILNIKYSLHTFEED